MSQERRQKALTSIVLGLVIAVSLLNVQLSAGTSSSTTIFSDNFESYDVGAAGTASNPCLGPPQGASNCLAPPKIGRYDTANTLGYWQPASSGTCRTRGSCVTWQGQYQMSPHSVYAIVSEQALSGVKSMKLGAGDWAFDKTQMGLYMPTSQLPSSGIVYWTTHIWASQGLLNTGKNIIDWLLPLGQIRVIGGVAWQISVTDPVTFGNLGSYQLTPKVWHTVTIGMDIPNNKWSALIIDGAQPFSSVNGAQGHNRDLTGSLGYRFFTIFMEGGSDYQSINSLGQTNGFYIYVDDVTLTTGTTPPTTTSTSLSTTLTSVGTTSTNPAPPVSTTTSSSFTSAATTSTQTATYTVLVTYTPQPVYVTVTVTKGLQSVTSSSVTTSLSPPSTSTTTTAITTASTAYTSLSTTSKKGGCKETCEPSQILDTSTILPFLLLLAPFAPRLTYIAYKRKLPHIT
jgi:hypothetical protein